MSPAFRSMIGSTLALMARSLREDSRTARNHLMRLLFVALIVLMLVHAHQQAAWVGAPGLRFFASIAWLNFWFILLAAPGYFASAITEEKEEQTLGLLRMADVGPAAIVLGKSVPRLLGAALLLSAQFPFTLLAVTLGGVSLGQVQAAYWTLLSWLLFSGAVGVFWSVVCRRSSGAAWMTALSLGAFLVVPWWLGVVMVSAGVGTGVTAAGAWLTGASPMTRLGAIMTTGFSGPSIGYQAVTNLAAAAVLLGLSWGLFVPCNRDERDAAPSRGLLFRRTSRLRALGAGRAWGPAPLPFVWKDFHFLVGGRSLMLVKLVLYGGLCLVVGFTRLMTWAPGTLWSVEYLWGTTLMQVGLAVFVVELALGASRVFREETKWKTLPNLLMLPHSTAAVAYSKVAGCLISLAPAVACFTLGALLWPQGYFEGVNEVLRPGNRWLLSHCVLFFHLVAWFSLLVRWGAIPLAAVAVFVLTAGWISLWELSGWGPRGPHQEHVMFPILIGAAVCGMIALHVLIGRRLRALAGE